MDFGSDPDGARRAVNQWVSDETEARIDDLVPSGSIDNMVRLVLTNAIYLKAPWEPPLDPAATSDGDFQLAGGATATVPFMHQSESFGFAEGEGWRAAEIPYRGGELSMVIVVPETGDPAGFVSVDEAGTEAAAATAVVMSRKSAYAAKAFAVDRPFLWLIRDVETGTVLVLGQVVDPSTESAG